MLQYGHGKLHRSSKLMRPRSPVVPWWLSGDAGLPCLAHAWGKCRPSTIAVGDREIGQSLRQGDRQLLAGTGTVAPLFCILSRSSCGNSFDKTMFGSYIVGRDVPQYMNVVPLSQKSSCWVCSVRFDLKLLCSKLEVSQLKFLFIEGKYYFGSILSDFSLDLLCPKLEIS